MKPVPLVAAPLRLNAYVQNLSMVLRHTTAHLLIVVIPTRT